MQTSDFLPFEVFLGEQRSPQGSKSPLGRTMQTPDFLLSDEVFLGEQRSPQGSKSPLGRTMQTPDFFFKPTVMNGAIADIRNLQMMEELMMEARKCESAQKISLLIVDHSELQPFKRTAIELQQPFNGTVL
jgi:hypothetical protein